MPEQNMTVEELQAQVAQLKAENNALKNKPKNIGFKVSQKGAISVYGLGRFPVTLYRTQWDQLLENADALRAFIEAHASELASKS
jgi:hypothetical protein